MKYVDLEVMQILKVVLSHSLEFGGLFSNTWSTALSLPEESNDPCPGPHVLCVRVPHKTPEATDLAGSGGLPVPRPVLLLSPMQEPKQVLPRGCFGFPW